MSSGGDLLIVALPGFTPEIGRLVSMLNYVRATTLTAISGLGVAELDYLPDSDGNSIGGILYHVAAAELGYQAATFDERQLNEQEQLEWGAAIVLGERARQEIKGRELGDYIAQLDRVRATTLAELRRRDDTWLEQEVTFGGGRRVNNYFKWFHVLSHEVSHRGQIQALRRQATSSVARNQSLAR
jgi:uncharacterized damage-inducible protein DinB